MTFLNQLDLDSHEKYTESHLKYLQALGNVDDTEEAKILNRCIELIGFDPINVKNVGLHIPAQLLKYGIYETEENGYAKIFPPRCGITKSLVIDRQINNVVLEFNHEWLEWNFFLKNFSIPTHPVQITVDSDEQYTVDRKITHTMKIRSLQMSFATKDLSKSWHLQLSCGNHWFDDVFCKVHLF
jgi:hypothetical protein